MASRPSRKESIADLSAHAEVLGKATLEAEEKDLNERIDKTIGEFDAQHKEADKERVDRRKKISKLSAASDKKRHSKEKAERKVVKAKLVEELAAEKEARMVKYREMAPVWRAQAIACEKLITAKRIKEGWHEQTVGSDTKVVGPHNIPKKMPQVMELIETINMDTPYEAAFFFLLTYSRALSYRGGKNVQLTMDMFEKVLHSAHYLPGVGRKLRKNTKGNLFLQTSVKYAVKSYFVGTSPLNSYEVDGEGHSVLFESCGAYKNEEGFSVKIEIHCNGTAPYTQKVRTCELKFENGSWRVWNFGPLLMQVVPPFEEDQDDKAELEREDEYRRDMKLGPRVKVMAKLKNQADKDYKLIQTTGMDGAGSMGFRPPDLQATKRRLADKKAAEELELLLAPLSPEERVVALQKIEDEKKEAKIARQRQAKADMEKLAESNAAKEKAKKEAEALAKKKAGK